MISKKTIDEREFDFEMGESILIDKQIDWTSFDVVKKIKNLTGVKKVGHAGTLDPLATGLLIVCTGRMTKEISRFQNLIKYYSGVFRLGITTDTFDAAGKIIETKKLEGIEDNLIYRASRKFVGEFFQTPPMFSAKKFKGKALYKYARKGLKVEREPVKVKVYDFSITRIDLPQVHFKLKCSKGFYVRALANDLGRELGCGAYLASLRREAIGEFKVEDALTVKEFGELLTIKKNS